VFFVDKAVDRDKGKKGKKGKGGKKSGKGKVNIFIETALCFYLVDNNVHSS